MKDISQKIDTLRTAVAEARIAVAAPVLEAVRNNATPKPDVLATARAAALLAVKNTAAVIPYCHPIPVEAASVTFDIGKGLVIVIMSVHTIYKTGCEMEALHGASVAALTIYDMLKPMDRDMEIRSVKLLKKTGGKSGFGPFPEGLEAAVVVVSDSVHAGARKDEAGRTLRDQLAEYGIPAGPCTVVPDEPEAIRQVVTALCERGVDLVLTTGGTGLSVRDRTPEAVHPLFDRDIPGIMEAAREHGRHRTPLAMLSRGVAGFRGRTLIVTLPGSTKGARESMEAVFPHLLHVFSVLEKDYAHAGEG